MEIRPIILTRGPRLAATVSLGLVLVASACGVARLTEGARVRPSSAAMVSRDVSPADPIVGTWFGPVNQPGAPAYNVTMQFSSPTQGTTDYAALRCAGKLRGAGAGGVYTFTETIQTRRATATEDGCIDGRISMRLVGRDTMVWTWDGDWQGEHVTASATLVRRK